ncbi:DoxX family protein [Vibrio palustris]|uniref:DoxX n=1 Tax=Vibrio palustris TaxID=1918946 RepID=A0A1R4B0K5_9VIBR|nr:DoxX family protein [Vibrio palustris]SJL82417.1 DoxX [Vibrio palustris]
MFALIEKVNKWLHHPDMAKLILRVGFGFLFLLHGIHKIETGTGFIEGLFVDLGLPAFFAYAVYLGEVVAPLMLILGVYSRIAGLLVVGTGVVVMGLMHSDHFFSLTKVGSWVAEDIAVYMIAGMVIALLGSGKYALIRD